MSMSRFIVNDDLEEVFTNKEIFFISVFFIFILFIFYPGTMLRKQVLIEKSNYELTAVYLENMLRLEPKNVGLLFATVKVSLENGNIDLANRLIEVLKKTPDEKTKKKLSLLHYSLLKIDKERTQNSQELSRIEEKMIKIINQVAKDELFQKENALIWYREAIVLSQTEAALLFLKPLYEDNDPYALEQCIYLATQPKHRNEKLHCVDKLSNSGGKISKKWLIAAYTLYSEEGDSEKALEIVTSLVKIDPSYYDELARVQQVSGKFRESSQTFMLFYKMSDDSKVKKNYLIKAIQVLKDGKLNSDAVALAQKYEDHYLHDSAMIQKLIKFYLSMGELEAAKKLSIKLLKKG